MKESLSVELATRTEALVWFETVLLTILSTSWPCLAISSLVTLLTDNSMIKPVFDYVNVIWTTCNKDNLGRVLKLQKRAARIILNADRMAPSVPLFNCLKWLPFYEDAKVTRCTVAYKRVLGFLPSYLQESLRLISSIHGRHTRYSNYNLLCPSFTRQTEGGRTSAVLTCQAWNSLPLELRKKPSLNSFRNSFSSSILRKQHFIDHF